MNTNTLRQYNAPQNNSHFSPQELTPLKNISSDVACLVHSYSTELAQSIGIECAVLFHHFSFWIQKNMENGKNFHEGKTWMYQTQKEIAEYFPYWSRTKIQKIIKKLIMLGLLIKGNFNRLKQDRTTWYAFGDQKKILRVSPGALQSPIPNIAKPEIGPPLPDSKNNIVKTYKKNNIVASPSFPSKAKENIVPFQPKDYVLQNGKKLSFRTAKLFDKYMQSEGGRERLLRNIKYYEDYCERGGSPSNHEAYIQSCFNNDYAKKTESSLQNDLYAQWFKQENNLYQMKILKTVVQFHKENEIMPISISKELPYQTFCDSIENFKRYHL